MHFISCIILSCSIASAASGGSCNILGPGKKREIVPKNEEGLRIRIRQCWDALVAHDYGIVWDIGNTKGEYPGYKYDREQAIKKFETDKEAFFLKSIASYRIASITVKDDKGISKVASKLKITDGTISPDKEFTQTEYWIYQNGNWYAYPEFLKEGEWDFALTEEERKQKENEPSAEELHREMMRKTEIYMKTPYPRNSPSQGIKE